MLKPGGFFRFVLPDLKVITKNYVAGYIDANQFMNESGLGLIERQRGIRGLAKTVLGNSQHLWLWDEQSIVSLCARQVFRLSGGLPLAIASILCLIWLKRKGVEVSARNRVH